jgi:predicted enzyme related to lactoylglutathione lyase
MSLSILNVTFDCSDAASTASFWSELTNWPCSKEEMPGNPFWVVALSAVGASRLVFVDVVDAKTVKNRIHLDLVPEDASQDQEVDRILFLGARIIDDRRQATPGGWVVMADPEGNEFCVEGGG